jgi:hypothetical protein
MARTSSKIHNICFPAIWRQYQLLTRDLSIALRKKFAIAYQHHRFALGDVAQA